MEGLMPCSCDSRRPVRVARRHGGFTLIELLIVVAIIGILASIAIPLFNNIQSRARVAKAQNDVRTLASALSLYAGHYGAIPGTLGPLVSSGVNNTGLTAGPFMASLPAVPGGWTSDVVAGVSTYAYNTDATGGYTITAAGDAATAKVP